MILNCPYLPACGNCGASPHFHETVHLTLATLDQLGFSYPQNVDTITLHQQEGYRTRTLLRLRQEGGRMLLGYFKRNSHEYVAVEHCTILHPTLNKFIAALSKIDGTPLKNERYRLYLQWIQDSDRCLCHLESAQTPSHSFTYLQEAIDSIPEVDARDFSRPVLYEEQDATHFYHGVNVFQQTNHAVNKLLRKHVLATCRSLGAENLLDMFCGNGNLSLLAAHILKCKVTGFDAGSSAITCAMQSVSQHHLRAQYFCRKAQTFPCADVVNDRFDLILCDPPRSGLSALLSAEDLRPYAPYFLLINCDLQAFFRDMAALQRHWQIIKLSFFDMFPHGTACEVATLLKRI